MGQLRWVLSLISDGCRFHLQIETLPLLSKALRVHIPTKDFFIKFSAAMLKKGGYSTTFGNETIPSHLV